MPGSVGQPTIGYFPWQASYDNANFDTRTNGSTQLGMGILRVSTFDVANYVEWNLYLDSVTWKAAMVYESDTDKAIMTIKFAGSSVGTIDMYAASNVLNNYAEVTGISVTTPGVKAVRLATPTKNASSSNYGAKFNSLALIATSGTYSTPGGSDTPGYNWHHVPWTGVKSGNLTRADNSTMLAGGMQYVVAQSTVWAWDVWLDSGTFKWSQINDVSADRGIVTVKLDGVSVATVDEYAAGGANNVYTEVTAISLSAPTTARALTMTNATKNASSSDYQMRANSIAWTRTGA